MSHRKRAPFYSSRAGQNTVHFVEALAGCGEQGSGHYEMARHPNASRTNDGKRWVNRNGRVRSTNDLFWLEECDCQVRDAKLGTRALEASGK